MKPTTLATLLLLLSGMCTAQTTLTVGRDFKCDAASAQPIVSFSEFECRGVPLYEGSVLVDQMFWLNGPQPEEWWLVGNLFASSPYQGSIEEITQFSLPTLHGSLNCNQGTPLDGTVTYTVAFTDRNGVSHTGTFSGNWGEFKVCGRYGWYLPVLQQGNSLVVQ